MFSDDYDPSDIPPDQAGYSYPVPANPLELPSMEWDDCEYDDITTDHDMIIWYHYWPWHDDRVEYDDYDPNDVPADQAAPAISGYLSPLPPPEYDVSCQWQWTYWHIIDFARLSQCCYVLFRVLERSLFIDGVVSDHFITQYFLFF